MNTPSRSSTSPSGTSPARSPACRSTPCSADGKGRICRSTTRSPASRRAKWPEIAREAQREGMSQFQVKLGADADWEADVARLRRVREAVGPGPVVYGDWNCGASRLDATRVGRAVADLDIMLEQPCRTLAECAAVKAATGLPMKLDETVHDTASLLEAYRLGCMDAVALKLSKFGGLSRLRQARDLCLHLGARTCVEDTWGSDIATAAALHLAAATPPAALLNVCDLSFYVAPRLDADMPVRRNGRIAPPEGQGLGVEPDPDVLGNPHPHSRLGARHAETAQPAGMDRPGQAGAPGRWLRQFRSGYRHPPGRGQPGLGRGWTGICRLSDRLRPDAARPWPSGGAGGGDGAAAAWHDLLRQQRPRHRAGRGDLPGHGLRRAAALRLHRRRGGHVRHAPRPRLHRAATGSSSSRAAITACRRRRR